MEDPWKHKSKGMSCTTCMWYVRKVKANGIVDTASIGHCRKYAPTMNGYPVVFQTNWCGDHKLNENSI